MALKEKIIGLVLVIIGALPFLLKIESITAAFNNSFFKILAPGNILYQIVIIILGILLIINMDK